MGFQFQPRDGVILLFIFIYGGGLAGYRHIKARFWVEATDRAALKRLAKLVNAAYLCRPTPQQRRTQPVPESVYWLGWRGILWVAAQYGVEVQPPANPGENQMRRLDKRLRDHGIRWLREPRWMQLPHDLMVIDFRLAIEQALNESPTLRLEQWIHETTFRADGDIVTYKVVDRDGAVKQARKHVYPDAFFVIVDEQRQAQGLLARARFLLELDHATHANERFGREKVAPGLAYIKSQEYKARFSDNSGRWLIVTTGKVRMRNLMRQTRQVARAGAEVFLFTTFDQLETGNVLIEPIWWQVGKRDPVPLFGRAQKR